MRAVALRFTASLEGLTPDAVALLLALGFVLGTFPIFGCPTLFCAAAALLFRLNLPALQVVNQLTSPLQLAMLLPAHQIGVRLIGSPHSLNPLAFAAQAVTGWFCLSVPIGFLLYFVLLALLRRCRPA